MGVLSHMRSDEGHAITYNITDGLQYQAIVGYDKNPVSLTKVKSLHDIKTVIAIKF